MKSSKVVIYFVFTLAILLTFYPVSTYLKFAFTWNTTVLSYFVLGLIVVAVVEGIIVPSVNAMVPSQRRAGQAFRFVLTTFCGYLGIGLVVFLFVRFSLEIPFTWMRGLFFPDWEAVRFMVYVAPLLSIGGAALELLIRRRQAVQKSPSATAL